MSYLNVVVNNVLLGSFNRSLHGKTILNFVKGAIQLELFARMWMIVPLIMILRGLEPVTMMQSRASMMAEDLTGHQARKSENVSLRYATGRY